MHNIASIIMGLLKLVNINIHCHGHCIQMFIWNNKTCGMSAHSLWDWARVYFLYQKENLVNSMLALLILDSYWLKHLMDSVLLLVNTNTGLLLVVTPDGFCTPIGQFTMAASYWLMKVKVCSHWLKKVKVCSHWLKYFNRVDDTNQIQTSDQSSWWPGLGRATPF